MMSEFPFGEIDEGYVEGRNDLESTLNNIDYFALANGNGPLELEELSEDQLEAAQLVAQKYGWPSLREDGLMEGVNDFSRPEDFIDSLCPDDEHGRNRHLSSSPFIRLLQCYPIADMREAVRMDDAMGISPVLHRAYAVAPDFFDSLRRVLNKLQERYGGLSDQDHLYEEFLRSSNRDVMEGVYMAYRLLGRLIKVQDLSISAQIQGYNDKTTYERVILNADMALRHSDVA